MDRTYKHLSIGREKDVLVIYLLDPKLFDSAIVTDLQDELLELMKSANPKLTVIDFSLVVHASTAVINGLLRAKKQSQANGGRLKLSGMKRSIRDAYRLLNLDGTVFQIHDTLQQAIDAF